jgi:hypothetical protein
VREGSPWRRPSRPMAVLGPPLPPLRHSPHPAACLVATAASRFAAHCSAPWPQFIIVGSHPGAQLQPEPDSSFGVAAPAASPAPMPPPIAPPPCVALLVSTATWFIFSIFLFCCNLYFALFLHFCFEFIILLQIIFSEGTYDC